MGVGSMLWWIGSAFKAFAIGPTDASYWVVIVMWIARLVAFSLITRTYLAPYVLSRFSKHIRVRSISLRSIRGLYFRKGVHTWRVDRIGVSYSSPGNEQARILAFKFEGVTLEIGKSEDHHRKPAPIPRHRRAITLADLSPSPLALHICSLLSRVYSIFDPIFRPVIRFCVAACLRQVIRYIPTLTQALQFDLNSAVVTFSAIPHASVTVEDASIHAHLSFTQLQDLVPVIDHGDNHVNRTLPTRALAMGAWRSRLSKSFKRTWNRTWDRTWGKTKGAASFSLKISRIEGLAQSPPSTKTDVLSVEPFFSLPGIIALDGSARFSPKDGTLDTGSLQTALQVGAINVGVEGVQNLLKSFQSPKAEEVYFFNDMAQTVVSSPMRPGSSLMEAFRSASSRSGFSLPQRPRKKISPSWLSPLSTFKVTLSSLTLETRSCEDSYNAVIHDISITGGISDPKEHTLHREWLGSKSPSEDNLHSHVYVLNFCTSGAFVERTTPPINLRILTIGYISAQTLVSQWPSPWVRGNNFISGDPNAALVVVRLKVEKVEVTERLEMLARLSNISRSSAKPSSSMSFLPSALSSVPRVSLGLEVGTIRARLICAGTEEPFYVEAETDGLTICINSNFHLGSMRPYPRKHLIQHHNHMPVYMIADTSLVLRPVFVQVCSSSPQRNTARRRFSSLPAATELTGNPLLSIEAIEVRGTCTALGHLHDDDLDATVSLETRSIFADLHCSCDAIFIELWHASVLVAVRTLLKSFVENRALSPSSSDSRAQKELPIGFALSMSVFRSVLFLTGEDINPDGDRDITRGLALRTGFSVQYCALRSGQVDVYQDLRTRSQARHKLYLPDERIMEAVASAKRSLVTGDTCVFGKVNLWSTAIRSAAASTFLMDDPYIAERDDLALSSQDFLAVSGLNLDFIIRGRQSENHTAIIVQDICEIGLTVGRLHGIFELVHMYTLLLATRTIKSFLQILPSHPNPDANASRSSVDFQGTIKAVQIRWKLPNTSLITRIDRVRLSKATDKHEISWNTCLLWVPLPAQTNGWEDRIEDKYEELGRLHNCAVSIPSLSSGTLSISVDGDSARLRIPPGYVFADLIFDAVVAVKCLRHLVHIVGKGEYCLMPIPEAEPAKLVPNIDFSFRFITLEAADDPLESKLSLIWRVGLEASKERLHREDAFQAKVSSILAAESSSHPPIPPIQTAGSDYQFDAHHSVTIDEARERLYWAHSVDWTMRYREKRREQFTREATSLRPLHKPSTPKQPMNVPDFIKVPPPDCAPPLLRATFHHLKLKVTPPSFPLSKLPDFLHEQGKGIPHGTLYSLLVPLHLHFTLTSLQCSLRDYPLPLLYIPAIPGGHNSPAWVFDSDIVVAEELGTTQSVEWIPCYVGGLHEGSHVTKHLLINVPKTIMPVKTYADPDIHIKSTGVTEFTWGVSYNAGIQDLMRVVETLSTAPRDSSPAIGFWDKMRLIFHWKIRVSFRNEVRLYMKGSRDPYIVRDEGAGFALCWQGLPKVLIGFANEDQEVVQVVSDTMLIMIPKFDPEIDLLRSHSKHHAQPVPNHGGHEHSCLKTCAKFTSGVRFGVGFVLERSCGPECSECRGTAFDRQCRHFSFRPHYDVKLEKKARPPITKSAEDSYNGFRSDFIHLSISLNSSVRHVKQDITISPNNFHLTPNAFAHFWSWWSLFDGVLSLPIRQGSYYPPRPISPKFGRHLATVKYRISVAQLFISHAYINESRESWVDGITPFVGVKARIDHFQADLHQRDQESIAPGRIPDSIKVIRHKPFYAAEVVLKGLDLRALLATFAEPLKRAVPISSADHVGDSSPGSNTALTDIPVPWFDMDDFVETDWGPSVTPDIHLVPVLSCPRLTYFKRNVRTYKSQAETSKFGMEHTHTCMLGKDISVPQVEISLASERIAELRGMAAYQQDSTNGDPKVQDDGKQYPLAAKITFLEDYITHLQTIDSRSSTDDTNNSQSYYMPSDTVSSDEWAEFENVYQVHSPKVFMTHSIRNVLMQYYYCSRGRRGSEYHMATRAVKFIRDQAEAILSTDPRGSSEKPRGPVNSAQAAASALRKIFTGDNNVPFVNISADVEDGSQAVDPLNGWAEGVSLRKGHFCLLLKPQFVLRTESDAGSICVLAAVQAKLQSFSIMDDSNLEDPVSGRVMTRTYTSLAGLQAFCPTHSTCGNGCVPLEVLVDYRCESNDFDRIVPQTDATFQYDKFNRLRLRNSVTSITKSNPEQVGERKHIHLHNETDLVQVHIPQFTVSASEQHFQAISGIVRHLILFSDAAHKNRLEKLETLLFTYDFSDLASAANVVADLQSRLRNAIETQREAESQPQSIEPQAKLEILKLKAHIFLLSEELNLIFDAIKLAQDRTDDRTDQKSALLLHALSSEISWRMLDEHRSLLAKLAVRNIDYSWLSKQDSSTVNTLTFGDLQAFDGSPHAEWAEIVSKYDEPSNHPLLKRGLFIVAGWTVLAPVGGITIYEEFKLNLHPIRLQLDARLGRRIMEYVWPARRSRNSTTNGDPTSDTTGPIDIAPSPKPNGPSRSSMDSPRPLQNPRISLDSNQLAPPSLRKGVSRSFTDMRSAAAESRGSPNPLKRKSTLRAVIPGPESGDEQKKLKNGVSKYTGHDRQVDDTMEMKTRSSQKTFILVKISSLHLLLSIMKAESFECRDARIRTRDLEYRNRTWTFEELVDQFIPSDMSWKGWFKVALHQPLVPVLPVARELISKTKWIASKNASQLDPSTPYAKLARGKAKTDLTPYRLSTSSQKAPPRQGEKEDIASSSITAIPFTDEPEPIDDWDTSAPSRSSGESSRPHSRARMLSFFTGGSSRGRRSIESQYQNGNTRQDTDETIVGPDSHRKVIP
ncbi:hypothetical protein SERLA73DRAFT_71025 [Serpula lacrymans var. lacrymans S7.3]|uniref:Uncharacterized protein n=1 Tax=Serpula lacrymans var. lacrymans (strain S7.3) TaxID=936435 RepID=F8PNY9_SERL3|nr:hypothetical protein SERLA73DRAFT_71025 [Serpula lacrymans var. lacrymans S7.3]